MPNLLTDPTARSGLMGRIRSQNTTPEVIVFRAMRARGLSFQRHYAKVTGSPDLARPRRKLAVFIDGDFWHGRELNRIEQKHGPDSDWARKLRRNIERDQQVDEALGLLGWSVLRVWESDVRRASTRAATLDRIESFLRAE